LAVKTGVELKIAMTAKILRAKILLASVSVKIVVGSADFDGRRAGS